MSENPYAPPQADVSDVPLAHDGVQPMFFAVSNTKLFVMSLCTLSLYQYFWYYRNWKLVQARTREAISPFWRAVFAIFYCYPLFKRIREAGDQSTTASLQAGLLATLWIIITVSWRLPDPVWLVTYLSVMALLPVQSAVNKLNAAAAPEHDRNARFSGWNWFGVIAGGIVMLLAIYGTLFPEAAR